MVQPIQRGIGASFSSLVQDTSVAIVNLAIQILFAGALIYTAWVLAPASLHCIVVPISTIGSVFLNAFLFATPGPSPQPLLPPGAPRGLVNPKGWNNCAINSVIQFLEADPAIARFLRSLPTDETDLETFGRFVELYHPPDGLWNEFTAQYQRMKEPPPVRRAFFDFMKTVAPSDFRETIEKIEQYGNAHQNLLSVYDKSDEPVHGSQEVRGALHRANRAIDPDHDQIDALEIQNTISRILPPNLQMRVQRSYHYKMEGLPPIKKEVGAPGILREGTIFLGLDPKDRSPDFHQMLAFYFTNDAMEPRNMEDVDGNIRPYPIDRIETRFLEHPHALYIGINRFAIEEGVGVKITTPIDIPPEIEVPLIHGKMERYRLAGFVHHQGETPKNGHYISGKIVDGYKYILNDSKVSLAKEQEWNDRLREAYLFCYLPIEAQ